MRVDGLDGGRRIVVYGVTGSGKSTLAEQLSATTGIPWHPVDDLTWRPGWIQVSETEQRRLIEEICAGPEWILDSAYGSWLEIPLSRADVVVALDYPRWLSWQRVVRRTLARWVRRTPICNGNYESLRRMLDPRESILGWHATSFAGKRTRIRAWADAPTGPAVLVLRTPRATRALLAGLRSPSASAR